MKGDLADQMAHLIMDENKAIEKEDGLQDFLMTTAKQRVLLRAIESLGGTVFLAHDMGGSGHERVLIFRGNELLTQKTLYEDEE